MLNPNAIYKEEFTALTERLGRVPNSADKEWWDITDKYRRAYAGQSPVHDSMRLRMLPDGQVQAREESRAADGQEARAAGVEARSEALSGPGRAAINGEAVLEPREANGPGTNSQGLMVGTRGPNGGVLAVCVQCGQVWERPKQRGRPAGMCEECR